MPRIVAARRADAALASARLIAGLADQDTYPDPTRVSQLLVQLGFTPEDFITRYTVAAVPSRN